MEKQTQKSIITAGVVIVLFYWVMHNLGLIGTGIKSILSLFAPFILGGAIAFVISVPMNFIERYLFQGKKTQKLKKFRRPLAFILTLLLVIAIIVAVVLVVVPEIGSAVADLINRVPKAYNNLMKQVESLLAEYPEIEEYFMGLQIDWESIMASLGEWLGAGIKGGINSGIGVVSGVVSGVVDFFIAFIFSIYILFQKENLARQGKKVLFALLKKERAEKIVSVLSLTHQTFSSFLSGQCLEAVILGAMFVVTMLILQLPYAWLMGVIITVTALIPMVGAFIGCFIGAFLILIISPVKALVFVIMFLVLQQLEGNLIYPHVVGKSVGLPGMWVLMAVTIGGSLLGIVGMLVFIPLFSVCYVLFREFVNKRLSEKKIKI